MVFNEIWMFEQIAPYHILTETDTKTYFVVSKLITKKLKTLVCVRLPAQQSKMIPVRSR